MPAEAFFTISAQVIIVLKSTSQGLKHSRYMIHVSIYNIGIVNIIVIPFILAFYTFQMSLKG